MPTLKSNIFWNMLRVGSNLLFPLITFPYASRILGPGSIGLFNYILAISSYFILFASFGFPIYGMREVAVVKQDTEKLRNVVNSIFTACMLFACIATAVYLILCYFILRGNFLLAAIVGISIILNSISFEWFFQGIEDFKYLTVRGIIIKSLSLGALFLFVKTESDLVAYAILTVSATCGNNILNLLRIRKYIRLGLQRKDVVKHVKGASVLFLGTVAISFYSYMNDILVGALTDMQNVGFFSTGNKIVHIILMVISAITISIVPRMSHLVESGDQKASSQLQKNTLNLILYIIIPMSVGLFILSKPAIELFAGDKFLPAIPALRILCSLIIIIPISSFLGNQILIPNRKEKYGNYAVFSGAIVNVCLALILIPRLSFIGVAISLVVAESVVTVVHIFFARHFMRLSISNFLPTKAIISSIIMGLCVFTLYRIDPRPGMSVIWSIIGIIIYVITLSIMRDELIFNIIKTRITH